MRYIDTSVLVPFYMPEARSEEAIALLRGGQDAYLSDLTLAEFSVTVWRKVRGGVLSEAAADTVLATLDEHCAQGLYHVEALTRVQVLGARALAEGLSRGAAGPLRTLDALHAAFAQTLGAILLTFDDRLAASARAMGISVAP